MNTTRKTGALVLAAGKGTRMKSSKPKVLHTLLGEPMLWYVHRALEVLSLSSITTVIGHGADQVRRAFAELTDDAFVLQTEQRGTGHALQEAWPALKKQQLDAVLVANGDTPLVPAARLRQLVEESEARNADIAFLTISLDKPGAYGRVIRDENGFAKAIVEAKDFHPEDHGGEVHEINAGIYWLNMERVAPLLGQLNNNNASGEFYITDLVALGVQQGLTVLAVDGGTDPGLLGVNSPAELVRSEELLRAQIVDGLLDSGVLVHNPAAAFIGPKAEIEPGCELFGPLEIYGKSRISGETCVQSHCRIDSSVIGAGSIIKAFTHLENAQVDASCQVGPYTRLRPSAHVCDGAKVGNFVEMKKSTLGKGSKASHLTYLGDAQVGKDVNIGAGTITCNYDGKNKYTTVIGDESFIGSNTSLVAPVEIGAKALVGAGSVITHNVSENSLGITRAKQKELPRRK
ncbi:bifunctional UDP-N-acetylglucosamine diphosphorylase/glucosamine-1-phosphate N-acetyltransferase GlmU [Desulfobaculum bizertense]|uniref:bifunctional UDP-N-acetylglucosamine diphosphorylase/glucosamine-1-phosphate N-acetyltransferase GlmU n=1 Tax=Desulfobaculum bizertense TaxID=376490 RepID=UPI001F35FCF9|nr:bifunctional UDP-N-acetylglucosamine diphosphorylase/glucosamine-1-phosphate N-acetyltransferase GlmU [Desulfobaculum bizertense]UIJ37263.1 bifunctional UDP-N-acetylglucosamine diphosphorylase/glucosamine-1-phosphate N-acetyltransferase GlmU [Desulfobaculum bizertense]